MHTYLTNRIILNFHVVCLSAVVLFFDAPIQAQNLQLTKTKVIDGFYIGVVGSGFTTNNTTTDNKLNFGIWRTTTNNQATVYIPTAPEYIFRIELLDTNGIALPKTELGKRVGTKFFDLDTSFDSNKGFKLRIERAMDEPDWGGQYLFFPFRPGYGGQPFYSPNDLFEIKNPSNYKLQIRFQIIVRTGMASDKTAHIVRFPPLDYPLVKPDTAPQKP
jgi:hypothetical protein